MWTFTSWFYLEHFPENVYFSLIKLWSWCLHFIMQPVAWMALGGQKVHHLSNPSKLMFCKFWKLLDLHSFNRCILYYFCLPYDHSNQLSAVNIIGTWYRYTGDRLDLHGGTLGARPLWAPRPRVRRDQGAVGARALAEADRGRPHHHGLLSLHIRHLLRRVLPLLLRCVLGPVLGPCV